MILELQHFLVQVSWKVLHLRIAVGGGQGQPLKSFFRITGVRLMGGKSSQAWTPSKGMLLFLQILQSCAYFKRHVLGSIVDLSRALTNCWMGCFFLIRELKYEHMVVSVTHNMPLPISFLFFYFIFMCMKNPWPSIQSLHCILIFEKTVIQLNTLFFICIFLYCFMPPLLD